jgi:hypothetical protein
MANGSRAVTQLATANLMIGGIAIFGWIAMAIGVVLGRLPDDLPERVGRFVDDAVFFAVLLCGAACLVAGVGLWKRRRWGRVVALAVGGVAGVLAIAGAVLVGSEVMRASRGLTDYFFLGLFAAYSGAVFVVCGARRSGRRRRSSRAACSR